MKDAEFQVEKRRSMKDYGMKISRTKTEHMSIRAQEDRVELTGAEIKKVKTFKYLGSVVQGDGYAVSEINRTQIGGKIGKN